MMVRRPASCRWRWGAPSVLEFTNQPLNIVRRSPGAYGRGAGDRMSRRRVLLLLLAAAATAPRMLHAQPKPAPGKVWRIGFFYYGSRKSAAEVGRYDAFS